MKSTPPLDIAVSLILSGRTLHERPTTERLDRTS
jgi:hypothetical protein